MFKHFGRLVEKLKRVKIGFLELGPLKPGEFRYLTAEEVERFRKKAAARRAATDDAYPRLLKTSRHDRCSGLSDKRFRPSYGVAEYMQRHGYRIIPVNPTVERQCWARNAIRIWIAFPNRVDIVDIFRRPEFVPEIVDAAIRIGARAVWMQEGVVHEEAAARRPRQRVWKW